METKHALKEPPIRRFPLPSDFFDGHASRDQARSAQPDSAARLHQIAIIQVADGSISPRLLSSGLRPVDNKSRGKKHGKYKFAAL